MEINSTPNYPQSRDRKKSVSLISLEGEGEEEMEVAEQQQQQQQWRQKEEEEEVEETEEEVVEEREEAAVALQGRRNRHPSTTAAAAIDVSDAGSGGEMLASSKPVNGFRREEFPQDEIRNGNKESNYVELDSPQKSEKNVFYDKDEGTESNYGFSVSESSGAPVSASEKYIGDDGIVVTVKEFDSQKSQSTLIKHRYQENLKDDSLSGFGLLLSEKASEEHKTNKSLSYIAEACDVIEPIKEIDQELTEFDVERVLEKQDTHDLFCPNCNSCITRRVILRKRKRKIRISDEDPKRNKLETAVASELDSISALATNDQARYAADISLNGSMTPAADDDNQVTEPEVFRCLSCFSIFIPTGKGFKLFKIFGDRTDEENMQSPRPVSTVKKNWFLSIFASRKEEMLIVQGNGHNGYVEENTVGASKREVTSPPQSFGTQGLVKSGAAKTRNGGDDIVPSSKQDPKLLGKAISDVEEIIDDVMKKGAEGAGLDHLELDTVDQLDSSSFYNEKLPRNGSDHPARKLTGRTPVHTEEPAENVIFKPQQDGLKILVHSSAESLTLEKSQMNEKLNVAIERKSAAIVSDSDALGVVQKLHLDDKDSKLLKPAPELGESDINEKMNIADFPSENERNIGATLATRSVVEANNVKVEKSGAAYSSEASQNEIIGSKVDICIQEPFKSDKDAFSLSVQDALLLGNRQVSITKDSQDMSAKSSAGGDTIIIVKGLVEPVASQEEAQDIIASAQTVPSTRTDSADGRGSRGVEIIKSMVYGGLIETIASLGIVSSAAGADAATLNIFALGVANLVGGLFVIGHNLWDLKNDHSVPTSNQVAEGASNQATTRLDRYRELLGQRENFVLHATIAVSSFLIFGLIPPVVYAFLFRESDNRDYKLIAVAVAALLCIIILGIGKAYVQRAPKSYIKTVMYYVVMGFMASGVSYAVGGLIKILLDKLGWFNSTTAALTLPVLETTTPMQAAWGSY